MKILQLDSQILLQILRMEGEGNSQWKRKCRLENCNEPIGERSKYCSKEHGIEFIKLLLLESKQTPPIVPPYKTWMHIL